MAGTAQARAGTGAAPGAVLGPVGPEEAGPYPAAAGYSLAGDDGAGPVGPAEAGSYPAARSGVRPGYNLVGEGEEAAYTSTNRITVRFNQDDMKYNAAQYNFPYKRENN